MKKNSFLNFPNPAKTFLKILFKKNKIKTTIMLFFCIFIFSIFSGCNEPYKNTNNNPKKVEILSYNITTEWSTGCTCDNTYEYHIETGFYHTIYMSTQASYFIRGEIKNIWKNKINTTFINLDFLSKNGTILFNTELLNATYTIYNLSKEETKSFLIEVKPELYDYYEDPNFYNQLRQYFQIVESIEFDIFTP